MKNSEPSLMVKYLFGSIIIFILAGNQQVQSQAFNDTVETSESSSHGPYQPVSDSSYKPTGLIREVPEKEVRKYSKNPDYAYANDPEYWKKRAAPKPGLFSKIVNSVLFRWIILMSVTGVAFYGMYQLVRENNFSWFSRKGTQNIFESEKPVPDEDQDFEKAIRRYHGEANYRMAIRFMFLRLIHTIRKNGGIRFSDSSTNAEIAHAFGDHPLVAEFRYLAKAYEYIFYGDLILGREIYDMLKNKFETFQETISS